ncbi:hypothetical protein PTKIN_Ptkin15bG0109000 [Pterospermum kingtungense]
MDIASSIAGSILEKLGSNAYQHIVSARGLGDELRKLKKTLEDIQTLLSAAEEKQDKEVNIRNWLEELKDVLHEVKNVLDEFEIQDQLRRQRADRGTTGSSVSQSTNKVRNLLLVPTSIGLRFKLSKKISKIWERLRDIEQSKNQFRLGRQERGSREQRRRDTQSGVDVHTVVPSDNWSLERLRKEIQAILNGRKFLLVLDDVWNEDSSKWEDLRNVITPGGTAGSKIIVTTRSKKVASIIGRQNGYELSLSQLSHDDCLSLFLSYAYIEREDEHHQNLVEIGKEIVNKCGGNPLAAKTLGSVLSTTTDEQVRLNIRDNEIWEAQTQGENDIMPALKLSYNQMPTYLKPCFAYCAVFPKAFKFNSADLIQLWSANGLIPSDHGNQDAQHTGMQLLEELLARCFFEDIEEYVFIRSFKMHDLVHDLARLVASDFLELGSKTVGGSSKKVRHLSIFDNGSFDQTIQEFPQLELDLRTILCPITLSEPIDESNIGRFILSCKYLWVLDLSSSSFEKLPSSIGHLKHLRYFSLSGLRIRKLPASICKLVKLQALGLGGCKKLEKLPKDVRNMINLRLLELTTKESNFPSNIKHSGLSAAASSSTFDEPV